ncbi:hypothetical protein [Haliangium ochraceum]|uniref:NHL repeat containing protein n=1 Tax=Haliangium ochraceum (strain DSM 14365 / JCM 11303 / SMP-2) TaxID=502025 RepID=D0LHF7_HALO1|nr:hypothetical protein [Haliangium ochraceum]ACY12819.1 hypothetical protein Hoch_0178 [Haliangium ochraceum DSM 14365]
MLINLPERRNPFGYWLGAGLAIAALALPACGDDGGDGDGNEPDAAAPDANIGDGVAPTVRISFPPPSSLTDSDSVIVRGTAADVDGIAELRINGTAVQTSDNFANWTATITLSHGANAIAVESEDIYGNSDASAAAISVVQSKNFLDAPLAIAADPANGRALVMDELASALLSVNYTTGERVIVSDDATGAGPEFGRPSAIALDSAGNRAFVLDGLSVLQVDLTSGERKLVTDEDTDTDDPLVEPRDLVYDPTGARLLLLDVDDPDQPVTVLYAVDIESGDRTALPEEIVPAGALPPVDTLRQPQSMAIDATGNRIILAATDVETDPERPSRALFSVDLETGLATVFSTNATADQGPLLNPLPSIAYDASITPGRVLALSDSNDTVLSIDTQSGIRTVVSDDDATPGQKLSVPTALALDAPEGGTARVLVVDRGIDMVLAVNIATGERTVLSGSLMGEGPQMVEPIAVALDNAFDPAGRAIVLDRAEDAAFVIDLGTSERTLLSDADNGTGTEFDVPDSLGLPVAAELTVQQESLGEVLVADPGAGLLFRVDLATGERRVLSGGPAGSGPELGAPRGVVFDPGVASDVPEEVVPARYLVVDEDLNALLAVDPDSGARTVVSDDATGQGPSLDEPRSVILELDDKGRTGRAIVVATAPAGLIAVDLATGDRTEITGENIGDGPDLVAPTQVMLELRRAPAGSANDFEPTGSALVVQTSSDYLVAVDLSTGRRTPIRNGEDGSGPELDTATRGVWFDAENGRLAVTDQGVSALFMVDLANDQRVIISR